MAKTTKHHPKINHDPGLGERYLNNTKRIINKDGSFNVARTGDGLFWRDTYQNLINMSWFKFIGLIIILYFSINLLFGSLIYFIGIEYLSGIEPSETELQKFLDAFYFSVQTFTTVGYGAIAPKGIWVNLIATLDALAGLLGFALATGLLYGRFSKPRAKLEFSKNALIAPYKNSKALMFRLVNKRSNILMELDATVMLMHLETQPNGEIQRKYYPLKLETKNIHFFPMNWTIVHAINEDSPLYGYDLEKLKTECAEILILIKGFDDTFSQVVHSRYSYCPDEILENKVFEKIYTINQAGDILVDIDKIHAYREV